MANETGLTLMTAQYASEIVAREVGESLQATVKILPHVWVEYADKSLVVKFPFRTTLTPAGYTDTTGLSLTAYQPTSTTVTAAPIGSAVRITDVAGALVPSVVADVANEQGRGIGAKIDTDLAALFPSFSTYTVGTTNTAMTTDTWLSAIGKLNTAKVPEQDRVGVLPVVAYQALLSDTQTKNAYAFQEAAKSGLIPDYFGCPIVWSTQTTTANSAVDGVGAMFNRRALGFAVLYGVNAEVSRAPAQFKATDIASDIVYGVALLDVLRGVKILAKNS